jgi:predicted site-specific integrase-resolvase
LNEHLLPSEVCAELGICRATLLEWTRKGVIKARRGPMNWRFYRMREVEALKSRLKESRRAGESLLVTA